MKGLCGSANCPLYCLNCEKKELISSTRDTVTVKCPHGSKSYNTNIISVIKNIAVENNEDI